MAVTPGEIWTVNGPIQPANLGITLTHEHLFIDLIEAWFEQPDSAVERALAREPVALDNLWFVRRNPLTNKDNGRLDSVEEAIDEVAQFRRAGGGTIVDVTPKRIGSDPRRVREVARETGLNVVHGTSFYTRPAHPPRVDDASVEELASEFEQDVRQGIGETDVPAGLIGELGVSGTVHEREEAVLRAGARAAARTGAPVSIHPPGRSAEAHRDFTYPTSRWALDILDIIEEEGLPPERVVFSHMDRSRFELDAESLTYQRKLADRGAYLEYDLWGTELSLDTYDTAWPSDPERIDAVSGLVEDGYASNLLFSQDVCMKIQRLRYGGFGYAHVLRTVLPMLRSEGIGKDVHETILVDNPARVLAFVEPTR